MLEKPAYLLGDFIIEIGLAGSIGLYKIGCFGSVAWGGVAQWIGRRISDQGVPGSIPRRCTFRCGLEQVTFTLCLVLVKPRKRWTDDRPGQTVTRLEITLCLMC